MQFEDKFVEGTNMGPKTRTDGTDRCALRAASFKRLPMQVSRNALVAHRGCLFRVMHAAADELLVPKRMDVALVVDAGPLPAAPGAPVEVGWTRRACL